MDIDLDVLNKITETAVKAACIRDYAISPLKKRCIDPTGNIIETDLDPPPKENLLFDLESCVEVYQRHKADGSEIYVGVEEGERGVHVVHDNTRTKGHSMCVLHLSEAIKTIYKYFYCILPLNYFKLFAINSLGVIIFCSHGTAFFVAIGLFFLFGSANIIGIRSRTIPHTRHPLW